MANLTATWCDGGSDAGAAADATLYLKWIIGEDSSLTGEALRSEATMMYLEAGLSSDDAANAADKIVRETDPSF